MLGIEGSIYDPYLPIAKLRDDDLTEVTDVFSVFTDRLAIVDRPVQKQNHIRILLDSAALPEVREHGPLAATALYGAAELRKGNDGYVEFFGELLQPAADRGYLLLAVHVADRDRIDRDELEVVYI